MKCRFLILFTVILSGCNIFSLVEAPYPETNDPALFEDPFNISQVLAGRGEQLKTDDYDELFSDNMIFDSPALSVVYRKREFLEVLERIALQNFNVEWTGGEIQDRGDALVLLGVDYNVYIDGVVRYSGEAEFRVLKGLEWKIEYWKDIPDDESDPFIK